MKKTFMVVLCALCLGVAAPALAASPSTGTYSGVGATQLSQAQPTATTSPTTTAAATTSTGTLPFTGVNVGLMVAAGVVLLGSGAVLRRRASSDRS